MIVDNALYRDGVRVPVDCSRTDLAAVRDQATDDADFVWVGLHEPDEEELAQVEEVYGLHPLAVEDALTAHQRPKLERYDDTLFLVLKTLWYVDENDAVETGEMNLFVGKKFVVSRAPRPGRRAAPGAPWPRGHGEGARARSVGGRLRRVRPGGRPLRGGRRRS